MRREILEEAGIECLQPSHRDSDPSVITKDCPDVTDAPLIGEVIVNGAAAVATLVIEMAIEKIPTQRAPDKTNLVALRTQFEGDGKD